MSHTSYVKVVSLINGEVIYEFVSGAPDPKEYRGLAGAFGFGQVPVRATGRVVIRGEQVLENSLTVDTVERLRKYTERIVVIPSYAVVRYHRVRSKLPLESEETRAGQIIVKLKHLLTDAEKQSLKEVLLIKEHVKLYRLGLGFLAEIPLDVVYVATFDVRMRFAGYEERSGSVEFRELDVPADVCYDGVLEDGESRYVRAMGGKLYARFKKPATFEEVMRFLDAVPQYVERARAAFGALSPAEKLKMALSCEGVKARVYEDGGGLVVCGQDTAKLRRLLEKYGIRARVKAQVHARFYDDYWREAAESDVCVDV